jgi:GNAT superfamily N-acetyltransferase
MLHCSGTILPTMTLQVTYMELLEPPTPPRVHTGRERIALERPSLPEYLALYRKVGTPLRWDQRLQIPKEELAALLNGGTLNIYVLRSDEGIALGFCELDRQGFPEVEIKNFGLIPEAQGRGLGSWLLSVALNEEWRFQPKRIWLHTDTWDHPSAMNVYARAGFKIYDVRTEESGPL